MSKDTNTPAWKLVPVDPSIAMCITGATVTGDAITGHVAAKVYAAMLHAASAPAVPQDELAAFEQSVLQMAVSHFGYRPGDALLKTVLERRGNGTYSVEWVNGALQGWQARAALPAQAVAAAADEPVAAMPSTDDRQPWSDDVYMESTVDWCARNAEAANWLADNHAAIRAALAAPVQAVAPTDARLRDPNHSLLAYVLQGDVHNRLTPRVLDIAYTAFMAAKQPNSEDGGPSDWFNDTKPQITKAIGLLSRDLFEDAAAQAAAQPTDAQDAGIEAAAKWIDKRRDEFDAEHGSLDPSTGAFEYGSGARGEAKAEYSFELEEIAEGIRALKSTARTQGGVAQAATIPTEGS